MDTARWAKPNASKEVAGFTTIYSFKNVPDGAYPEGGLTSENGVLYGTSWKGGANDQGTVFMATVTGHETVLYSFTGGSDGQEPQGAVVVNKRTVYGVTERGGSPGDGVVFAVTSGSGEQVLHAFTGGNDGSVPMSGLTLYKQRFYGSTVAGGASSDGTLFSVDPGGGYTQGRAFNGGPNDGARPAAPLSVIRDAIYGTTQSGGAYGGGVLFVQDPEKGYSVIHSFGKGSDGTDPGNNGVTLLDHVVYGTTCAGGLTGRGTVFTVSASGTERTLYNFGATHRDGTCPNGTLVSHLGVLYGVTAAGGAYNDGTVFSITARGRERILHSFRGPQEGIPIGSLVFLSGKLYGVTSNAGVGYGTVFSLKL